MIYIIISSFLDMIIILYLLSEVNKNKKLIRDLTKITIKLAEKILK